MKIIEDFYLEAIKLLTCLLQRPRNSVARFSYSYTIEGKNTMRTKKIKNSLTRLKPDDRMNINIKQGRATT